jgi:hypothetical protein
MLLLTGRAAVRYAESGSWVRFALACLFLLLIGGGAFAVIRQDLTNGARRSGDRESAE